MREEDEQEFVLIICQFLDLETCKVTEKIKQVSGGGINSVNLLVSQ